MNEKLKQSSFWICIIFCFVAIFTKESDWLIFSALCFGFATGIEITQKEEEMSKQFWLKCDRLLLEDCPHQCIFENSGKLCLCPDKPCPGRRHYLADGDTVEFTAIAEWDEAAELFIPSENLDDQGINYFYQGHQVTFEIVDGDSVRLRPYIEGRRIDDK